MREAIFPSGDPLDMLIFAVLNQPGFLILITEKERKEYEKRKKRSFTRKKKGEGPLL